MYNERPLIRTFLMLTVLAFAAGMGVTMPGFGQSADAADLKADLPGLCYQCHAKTKETLSRPFVHAPFKQGKCSACHNAHATRDAKLLSEGVNAQCLGCHEKIRDLMKKSNVHNALVNGLCTDCHDAHGSGHQHLLVADEKNLCWKCHETLKDQTKMSVVHAPFRDGKCSSCHNPHASGEDFQLVAAASKTCKTCHAPQCKAGGVSIASRTKDMDCISCHAGHSSNAKGLLGPFGHATFLARQCDQCHNAAVPNSPMTTKAAGKELCFSCHKKDPAKYRDDDVHAGDAKNPCVACHRSHGASKKNLTVNETQYCATCHQPTVKRIAAMQKSFGRLRCTPIRERKCFACHVPLHSKNVHYLKGDGIVTCTNCHTVQHKVSHPMGANVIDPRNGQTMSCLSCHSMHTAKSDFMLTADRKRQLCVQCHKKT